jgi:hypothetical protein
MTRNHARRQFTTVVMAAGTASEEEQLARS